MGPTNPEPCTVTISPGATFDVGKMLVMDAVITVAAVIWRALTPAVKVTSWLDDILKPPVAAAWAAPRVSPVRVMVIAAVPDATPPPVVRTMVVLADVAVPDVAVKEVTVLAIEETDPKK
jgi:hypothetical protein